MTYLPRTIDAQLGRMLTALPAIAVEGPRAVGKTASALRCARSVIRLDDAPAAALVEADPGRLARVDTPVLLDEWQRAPRVWDLVRRAVDADPSPGRFLLTGSAMPSQAPTHSGAGRIVRVRMRPLSLSERQVAPSTVSLSTLLDGGGAGIGGDCNLTLGDYAEEVVASGFPALRGLPLRERAEALDGYLQGVVQHDLAELGHVVRRPETLRQWLAAHAAATSTTASYNSLLDAASAGLSAKPAKTTTIGYRDVLARLWLIEELPAWSGSRNHLVELGQAPKHHLADPALAARLLGVGAGALVDEPRPGGIGPRDGTLLGALFESLVTLSVRVGAQAAGARVAHLRTRRGEHEIDLIVARDDGRFVAIEVKLGAAVEDRDMRHLRWARQHFGEQMLDAVVVTTGPGAYRRPDGIAVVPAGLLGA